jgi:hypothetical protein
LRACLAAPDIATARASLAAFKAEVKPRYRALVRSLHPDLVGDCPAKAEALRAAIELWQSFDALKIAERPARPAVQVVRIHVSTSGGWTSTHTNTSTTTGFGGW